MSKSAYYMAILCYVSEFPNESFKREKLTNEIANKYNLKEGLVLKGVSEGKTWMVKVKTQEWLDKVRAKYGIDNDIE